MYAIFQLYDATSVLRGTTLFAAPPGKYDGN